jgi:ribulose-5-phosphate 4-epimerase/fuculose-1-phosphate aldolase
MNTPAPTDLPLTLLAARERCARQGLLAAGHAGISLRLPGSPEFLFLDTTATQPQRESTHTPSNTHLVPLHARLYRLRPDVGAILAGGGVFSTRLHDLGGSMPVAFDEQARHLGRMAHPAPDMTTRELQATFADGTNTALVGDLPVCLGTTCQRLVLNAELFEKCAKAYVLAAATGQRVTTLPWWVRTIAIGRLRKDQRQAAERFAQGLLPQETRGY